ncbi:MAG: PLP-dependent transferase [Myxococcales bacterium]|nr:PLP-dependent transferase [Myxococcales bacterium]
MMPHSNTLLIHAGEDPRVDGAVSMPIFQSAMYLDDGAALTHDDIRYIRLNNTPNHRALAAKLAAVSGAEAALVTASGMAAISAALFSCLRAGDEVLVQADTYGGTHGLVSTELPQFGIDVTRVDGREARSWEAALTPRTRAFYVESLSNPLMQVADLESVVAFCQAHELVSIVDNTFLTPLNFRALALGFEIEVHSATKYLNGHSDLVAGVVLGSEARVKAATSILNHLGGALDPHACFLFQRGVKTLGVRMRAHNENGLRVAQFLADHPAVARVNYPGLPQHPDFERASRLFSGFSGMLSFELAGGVDASCALIERLQLPLHAPSLGGVESLITRPATTSHSELSPPERLALGVTDGLVRVSLGIEDADDLVDDFAQALDSLLER